MVVPGAEAPGACVEGRATGESYSGAASALILGGFPPIGPDLSLIVTIGSFYVGFPKGSCLPPPMGQVWLGREVGA
jgi:hypothetical protein